MNYQNLLDKVNSLYKVIDESFVDIEYEKLILFTYLKEYNNFQELDAEYQLIINEVIYTCLANENNINKLFIDKNISNKNNSDTHVLISLFHFFLQNSQYLEKNNTDKITYLLNVFDLLKTYRYKKCKEINIRNKNTTIYNNMLIRYSNTVINSNIYCDVCELYYDILEGKDETIENEIAETTEELNIECKLCGKKNKIHEIDGNLFYECIKCKNCDLC